MTDFYESNVVPLPEGMKFRQLKIQLENGKWKKYRGISSEKKLNSILKRRNPLNVYNTVSAWLDVKLVERPNYVADRILLGTLIPVDFDSKLFIKEDLSDEQALRMAEEESFKVKDFISTRWSGLLTLKEHKFSGGGFHLMYDVFFPPIPHPVDRIKYHVNFRKIVAESLENEGFVFDKPVTLDLFRVIRMTNTFNGNKNKVCTLHARNQDSLVSMTKIQSLREEQEIVLSDIRQEQARLVDKRLGRNPNGLLSEQVKDLPSAHRFIDVRLDDKHYVPFLVLPITSLSERRLIKAAKTYGHKFYVYKDQNHYLALSTRLVDFRRYQRILRSTKALNERTISKYKHGRIKITSTILLPINKEVPFPFELSPRPFPVAVIGTDKKGFHSKNHFELIKKDFEVNEEPELLDKWKMKTKTLIRSAT